MTSGDKQRAAQVSVSLILYRYCIQLAHVRQPFYFCGSQKKFGAISRCQYTDESQLSLMRPAMRFAVLLSIVCVFTLSFAGAAPPELQGAAAENATVQAKADAPRIFTHILKLITTSCRRSPAPTTRAKGTPCRFWEIPWDRFVFFDNVDAGVTI